MRDKKICAWALAFFLFYFLLSPGVLKAEKIKVRVISENAKLLLSPDPDSRVIMVIPLGTVLESEEQTGSWFKVSLPPDEKGFVNIYFSI